MEKKLIRLSKCSLKNSEYAAVIKVLKSDYLGMGHVVKKFENKLSSYFKREAVCVSTGTSALHLALQSLNLKYGDQVIIPSLNYVSGFQAVTAARLVPVLCDVRKIDLSMSTEDLKKKINKKTKVIMPTLYGGNPGNIDEIYKIAKKFNLRVVEDAAHAFGSYKNSKLVGSFGDISCFSFDGIKNITSGEGGCVVTNDKKIIKRIKDIRFLGIKKESEKRYNKKKQFEFDVSEQGWRNHMSDIMASIGIEQLKKISYFRKKRQILAKYYIKLLSNNKNIELLDVDFNKVCPHIFVIVSKKKFNRRKLKEWFSKNKIEVGYHWKPIHELSFFKKNYKFKSLANTNNIKNRILTLPIHVDLKKNSVERVSKKVNEYFNDWL